MNSVEPEWHWFLPKDVKRRHEEREENTKAATDTILRALATFDRRLTDIEDEFKRRVRHRPIGGEEE